MKKNKTAIVIRHLAFEDLGSFASILLAQGYRINYLEASNKNIAALNPLTEDLLIILGGPISVNDAQCFPFINQEIKLLKQRIDADKPTLGICLGAQLIASALGEKIYKANLKEIGWAHITLTPAGEKSALAHIGTNHCSVLHWHGETFNLPENATLLASTKNNKNQAFCYGEKILALQFHPEVTVDGLEEWYLGHIGEINQTPDVSVQKLRYDANKYGADLEKQAKLFLRAWLI